MNIKSIILSIASFLLAYTLVGQTAQWENEPMCWDNPNTGEKESISVYHLFNIGKKGYDGNLNTPVLTKYFGTNGEAFPNITDLSSGYCPSTDTTNQIKYEFFEMCDHDTLTNNYNPFMRVVSIRTNTSYIVDYDYTGQSYTPTGQIGVGLCDPNAPDSTQVYGNLTVSGIDSLLARAINRQEQLDSIIAALRDTQTIKGTVDITDFQKLLQKTDSLLLCLDSIKTLQQPTDCTIGKIPNHNRVTNTTATYSANTVHSISFSVIQPTSVSINGGPFVAYPAGYSNNFIASYCEFLDYSFDIDATNGGDIMIISLE